MNIETTSEYAITKKHAKLIIMTILYYRNKLHLKSKFKESSSGYVGLDLEACADKIIAKPLLHKIAERFGFTIRNREKEAMCYYFDRIFLGASHVAFKRPEDELYCIQPTNEVLFEIKLKNIRFMGFN